MKFNPTITVIAILCVFLFVECKLTNVQDPTISIESFIESVKKNKVKEGQLVLSQYDGIRLLNSLQCAIGLPYSGYIVFDSITSQRTYSEFYAVWITADSVPYFSILGNRNNKDELILVSKKLSQKLTLKEISKKPAAKEPKHVHNLRMDAPTWNPPNSFSIGIVSLSDYFSIENIAEKDSVTVIGKEEDIRSKGFRFLDRRGWEYEVRTSYWNKGPITKVVVSNLSTYEALSIIQDYIDYTGCYPEPFFYRVSLGKNPSKIYKKDELRVVEAYYQNSAPDYRVTIDYVNHSGEAVLTFKFDHGYYLKKGVQKILTLPNDVDEIRDLRKINLDETSWEKLLLDNK